MQAYKADLTPFAGPSHNGKLIQYVGWADQLITAVGSLDYYETVRNFTENHTGLKTEDFYRLFPVPGMLHWYALPNRSWYSTLTNPPPPSVVRS